MHSKVNAVLVYMLVLNHSPNSTFASVVYPFVIAGVVVLVDTVAVWPGGKALGW